MKLRVIWIDEDEYSNKSSCELLTFLGVEILFFTNYEEGYQALANQPKAIDALMLDVMMPPGNFFTARETKNGHLTGFLLYKKIREFYHGPILMYTVIRDKVLVESYIRGDGKARHLNKPAGEDEIYAKLMEMIK